MNEKDVLGHLRAEGIRDMREVHLAVVEHDGRLSVLKQRWAEPAQKTDVLDDERRARHEAIRTGLRAIATIETFAQRA